MKRLWCALVLVGGWIAAGAASVGILAAIALYCFISATWRTGA